MQTLRIHHEHFHEWLNALQLVEIRGVRLFLFEWMSKTKAKAKANPIMMGICFMERKQRHCI